MDDLQTIGGGSRTEVSLVHQGYRKPSKSGITSDARTINSSSDNEYIVSLICELT